MQVGRKAKKENENQRKVTTQILYFCFDEPGTILKSQGYFPQKSYEYFGFCSFSFLTNVLPP